MARYRDALPQLGGQVFLTDTGIETTLIFHDGYDLPYFAAVTLLRDKTGRARLDRYFLEHAQVAAESGTGFILESATWRASPDWGVLLGYSRAALADANRIAIEQLIDLRAQLTDSPSAVVVSGCIGPRGDGYDGTTRMMAKQACDYHAEQIQTFAATDADMVHAMTIAYPDEAVGVVLAAHEADIPVAISFTVETDGALPDGTRLGEAIGRVDDATGGTAAYFAINCAHPTHFANVLDPSAGWAQRLRGVRANASRKSDPELDESGSLDAGDPLELGAQYADLRTTSPNLTILGGCCGTDVRHLRAIADALTPARTTPVN
jgi:S-methylmethionine-dependent homocysteine/selenocysteine methylase